MKNQRSNTPPAVEEMDRQHRSHIDDYPEWEFEDDDDDCEYDPDPAFRSWAEVNGMFFTKTF